jgi:hypothetical protein
MRGNIFERSFKEPGKVSMCFTQGAWILGREVSD